MKKNNLKLACVTFLSALVLSAGAGSVLADEVVANNNSSDTAIVDTTTSTSSPTDVVTPTVPSNNVNNSSSSNDVLVNNGTSAGGDATNVNTGTSGSSNSSSDQPVTDSNATDNAAAKPADNAATKPADGAVDPTKPVDPAQNSNVKDNENKGQSNAAAPVSNAPVIDPLVNPVTTNSGVQIVGVQNSNPIVANLDGTTTVVAPESIGAEVNPDKTITVTTNSGSKVTLPSAGTKTLVSTIVSLVGLIAVGCVTFLRKTMTKNN